MSTHCRRPKLEQSGTKSIYLRQATTVHIIQSILIQNQTHSRIGLTTIPQNVTLTWGVTCPSPNVIPILSLPQRNPHYHRNLIVSSVAHVMPFRRILWKSVQKFLHNPANIQTNASENITPLAHIITFSLLLLLLPVDRGEMLVNEPLASPTCSDAISAYQTESSLSFEDDLCESIALGPYRSHPRTCSYVGHGDANDLPAAVAPHWNI